MPEINEKKNNIILISFMGKKIMLSRILLKLFKQKMN